MKRLLPLAVLPGQTAATTGTPTSFSVRAYLQNTHWQAFSQNLKDQPETAEAVGDQFVADVTTNQMKADADGKLFDFAGMLLGSLYQSDIDQKLDTFGHLTKAGYGVYMGYCKGAQEPPIVETVWLLYNKNQWKPDKFPNPVSQPLPTPPGSTVAESSTTVQAQEHCTYRNPPSGEDSQPPPGQRYDQRAGVVASFTPVTNTPAAHFMNARGKKRMVVAVMHWDHSGNSSNNQQQLADYLKAPKAGTDNIGFNRETDELLVLADTNCSAQSPSNSSPEYSSNVPFLQSLYTLLSLPLPTLASPSSMPIPERDTCCTDAPFEFYDRKMIMNSLNPQKVERFDRIWSTMDLAVDAKLTTKFQVDPFGTMADLNKNLGYNGQPAEWNKLTMHNPIMGTYTVEDDASKSTVGTTQATNLLIAPKK